ncbi:hypothetical protein AN1V17_24730 [Vallitalea sediminicola]
MLEDRIFKSILKTGIALSAICIIGNIIFKFPLIINTKWIFLIIICFLALHYETKETSIKERVKFSYFIFIILFFIPVGWFDSGGTANNTIAYVFILLICITYLFNSKKRTILVIMLIATFNGLYIFEHIRPDLINSYSSDSQFWDRLLQIPLTLYASYYLIKRFATAYTTEKNKQEEYSVQLKEANHKLHALATFDSLTNVNNRRIFDDYLQAILIDEEIIEADIYVALLDIDNFKKINDTYGHLIGDELLVSFAEKAREIIIAPNMLARWGGDEFAIIYFGNEDIVKSRMNDLLQTIRNIGKAKNLESTISIGLSRLKPLDTVIDILSRADLALYEAKSNGRNQFILND